MVTRFLYALALVLTCHATCGAYGPTSWADAEGRPQAQHLVEDAAARRQNAQDFANTGLAYFQARRYDLALIQYNLAVDLEPSNPDHFYSRGTVLGWLGYYDDAIVDLQEAIRLKPDFQKAWIGLRNTCDWRVYYLSRP